MSLVEQLYSSKWLAILALGLLALSSCNGRSIPPSPPKPTPKENNESANNDYLTIKSITVGNTVISAPVESVITYEE